MDKIRILITEDEPIIAADLEDRLTDAGYEVLDCLASGEETLEFLNTSVPDIMIMDVRLEGELDGIETVQKIKEQYNIPTIFLTSNTDSETFNRAKQTNPHAFIGKPFRGKDLQHSIELAVSNFSSKETNISTVETGEETNSYLLKDRIFIKEKKGLIRLFFKDILWIEADGYYCKMNTLEKSYLVTMTLKKLMESNALPDWLIRIHRSYLVNVEHIERVGDLSVFINRQKVPVGNSYKNNLKNYLKML
jgi:DNA-binding LytR/AlgR family response regulator